MILKVWASLLSLSFIGTAFGGDRAFLPSENTPLIPKASQPYRSHIHFQNVASTAQLAAILADKIQNEFSYKLMGGDVFPTPEVAAQLVALWLEVASSFFDAAFEGPMAAGGPVRQLWESFQELVTTLAKDGCPPRGFAAATQLATLGIKHHGLFQKITTLDEF